MKDWFFLGLFVFIIEYPDYPTITDNHLIIRTVQRATVWEYLGREAISKREVLVSVPLKL